MHPYDTRRADYRARRVPPIAAMRATTATTGSLLMHIALDAAFLLGTPMLFTGRTEQSYEAWLVLAALTLFVMILILGGRTPGMILLGLSYAYEHEYRLLRWMDYTLYLIESFPSRFRYHDTYETLSFLFGEDHQSPPMKEHGLLVVKRSMYRRFLEDYEEDGVIQGSAMDANRLDRTPAVFVDHEE